MQHRLLAALAASISILAPAAAGSAKAADIPAPIYKAPPKMAVAPNWTGFYVGANIGGGWGSRSVDFAPNDPITADAFGPTGIFEQLSSISFTSSGVIGGLQLGYNWQLNRNWLVGFEADVDWSGMKGSGSRSVDSDPNIPLPFTETVDERIKWFGTVRARLGYLPIDNLLMYITGGFAYGKVEHTGSVVNETAFAFADTIDGFSEFCASGATCYAGSSSGVATGWTVGGGLEYAVWQNWSVKAEYLYVSLDSKSVTQTALAVETPGATPSSFAANYGRTSFNVARIGLNYRF